MSDQLSTKVGCKEMLLWRLSYAVSCSVLSQVLFLIIFLFFMNFNIFHPVLWIKLTISTLTSFGTWLYLVPLATIIFAQGVICSKDYIYDNPYKTTRFSKLMSVFSLRNLFLLTLHVLTGWLIVWLYLSLLGGKYSSLYKACKMNSNCLIEETFFMLFNGMWIGLFYFVKEYLNGEKNFIFPVIQQSKLLTIKSTVVLKLRQSIKEAFWPTLYFIVIYYYKGVKVKDWITSNSFLHQGDESLNLFHFVNSPLLIYSWLFSTLFIFTMLCMRLFFEVFLTEQWSFPIESEFSHILTLKEALAMNNLPIIQHLACLDLYNLSRWDPSRRQQLFKLSQPGGHPHNWNRVLEEILKLVTEFSSEINKATDAILSPELVISTKSVQEEKEGEILTPNSPVLPQNIINSESFFESSMYSPNSLRNMALPKLETTADVVSMSSKNIFAGSGEAIKTITIDKFDQIIQMAKRKSGIQYLFGDIPESRIYFLLSKGQPVIWAIQGLSFIATASFTEDTYGIVQKDLPVIVTSLVTLKQNLDKLNKVSTVNRKSMQGEQIRMQIKAALRTTVRRSLYNISNTFGEYLSQIPLSKDVHQQMLAFVAYREG